MQKCCFSLVVVEIVYRFPTQSSIRECVFRLRDQEGMGIISGASRAPQGQVRSPTGAANQFGQDIEAAEYGNLQPSDLLKIGHNHGGLGVSVSHSVCGLNQWIGSFSRSVPNKLPSRQKVTLRAGQKVVYGR